MNCFLRSATSVLFALAACHSPKPTVLQAADYPGTLRQPTALPLEVMWHQHVTAHWGEGQQRGFEAAVQRQADALTVLGMSPMGSVGFAIVQRPDGIDVDHRMPDPLVFPPRFILLDVQRVFYPWLGEPVDNGERVGNVDGERVRETWQGGRLQQRSFTRNDGTPPGDITIRYAWDRADWQAPTRAVLDNGWFGYSLTIETHSETRLAAAEAASDS